MSQRLVWNFELSTKKIITLSAPPPEPDHLKWEIRYFWPEEHIISLYNINDSLLDIANYQQKHKEDYYYLLPDCEFNIKRRRDELLYKPIIKRAAQAIGFGTKINLETIHTAPEQDSDSLIALKKIVYAVKKKGTEICVKKESFTHKFATIPSIKLELARLEVNNQVFFSACIEGKSLYLVETINEHLLDKNVSCEYVTFLKSIIKS